ncbi:MAG: AAA family ATPase [Roseburia sp.]
MYQYITIERQYCSGGQEIAELLAKKLGYKLYDHNILVETAKRLELPTTYIVNLEETAPGNPIFNMSKTAKSSSKKNDNSIPMAEKVFTAEKAIIEEAANEGNCIIVGRCASHILADKPGCLKVFIGADDEYRMKRAVERERVKETDAAAELKKVDKRRSDFFKLHSGAKWGDISCFDICLDSGKLGKEACVEILAAAVKQGWGN